MLSFLPTTNVVSLLFIMLIRLWLTYKVEDYYEIIKEPMDFGTMRAKLHEGMYKSLAQFEVCTCLKCYLSVFTSESIFSM